MRGYVDSKIVEEAERCNNLWKRVDTQVKVEERERKREGQRMLGVVEEVRVEADVQIKQL